MQLVTQYEFLLILIGSLVMYYQQIVHRFTKCGAVQRVLRNLKGSAANLKVYAQQE